MFPVKGWSFNREMRAMSRHGRRSSAGASWMDAALSSALAERRT